MSPFLKLYFRKEEEVYQVSTEDVIIVKHFS